MYLPDCVLLCIRMLEDAGFTAYAVGGCVRDSMLGLPAQDYDLCTSARPEETCQVFSDYPLIRNGEKHGTIGVIMENQLYEITTFRTEGDYRDCRHPGWVRFVPTVEEDLARRDFTINAMAYTPSRGFIDPWGGQEDLKNRILRAVGNPATRFEEDALRILRGVRFSVRYGLLPDPETWNAMQSQAYLMKNLASERMFDELCKLIVLVSGENLLDFAPVLTTAIPELQPCVGFQQHCPYHRYDVLTHIAHVVEAVPQELALRWAALLHDIGKPAAFTQDEAGRGHFNRHAKLSAQIADTILLRLKAPTKLRERVVFLVANHMLCWEPDKRLLRRRISKYGSQNVKDLLILQRADFCSKGTGISPEGSALPKIQELFQQVLAEDTCLNVKDLAVNGRDLLKIGFPPSPGLGKCLSWLLTQVLDELLPNSKEALLSAAEKNREMFLS